MTSRSLTKRKSPLAWVGGKSQLAATIIPLIPKDHKCYVEVFAGASWVLFRKDPSKVEVINDINNNLITLYRVIQNHLDEFLRYFKWQVIGRSEFDRLKAVNEETLTDIQRAARFYYLVKSAFGAKITNPSYGVANSSKPRLNLTTLPDDLQAASERLQRVSIENLPYSELIKRYDGQHVFFYIDPPYWDCENDYGKDLFSKEDFTRLHDALSKVQGKWLMSINNVPQIRELFKDYNIKEVLTRYSIATKNKKPVTELLIANYPI